MLEILKKDVTAVLRQARTTKSKIALVFTLVVLVAMVSGSVWFWAGAVAYGATVFHRVRLAEAAKAVKTPAKHAKN